MDDQPNLAQRDSRVAWHPYTQHGAEPEPLAVRSAHGATLELDDGRHVLDAISSWWCCLHGHGRPELVAALARQAATLDHVLFAGCTHAPAVELAERLRALAPTGLSRAFFSDNGSTAVEVALKMVLQRHLHQGEPQRRVFVALDGAYHGDTFGAMAVGDPEPFFAPFASLLFEVRRSPATAAGVAAALDALGPRAAGVVLEPLVQGAAGMVMQPPEFVRAVRAACDARGLPLVADEVMTGFGRTGALFACSRAGIAPDYLCLAKGLTGGVLPLAVTLTSEATFQAFLSEDRGRAFFHGHTFTANAIGCAVALASLDIVEREDTPAKLDAIGARIEAGLAEVARDERVVELRRTGGIVALELRVPPRERGGYLADLGPRLRREAIARGVLLRPLGPVLYALPPACTTPKECATIARVMGELVRLED